MDRIRLEKNLSSLRESLCAGQAQNDRGNPVAATNAFHSPGIASGVSPYFVRRLPRHDAFHFFILSISFALLSLSIAQAQVNRYMVFFVDKAGTPHSISSPETFLSARALQRRSNQNISISEQDLPVTPGYVEDVRNAGVTVLYNTKWMNGVLVECTDADVSTLEALSFVSSVEYVAPDGRPASGGRKKSSRKFKDSSGNAAVTDVQLAILGLDAMHEAGYRGEGMLIAIMDAGFQGADTISFFRHVFDENRFDAATSYDFVSGGSNVFQQNNHGTNVWSTIAAFKVNEFIGGAFNANFILFVTEHDPTEYRVEEYHWLFAAERADSAGVDVINTSLGYNTFDDSQMNYSTAQLDGQTTVITRAAEIAVGKGIAVVVSAGNEGSASPTTITAPADGENVLAVGAVTAEGVKTSFSSIGPSADGRIKPDVVALGSLVSVIKPDGTLSSSSGTSLAAPLATSLVTGVWQRLPELSAKEILDTIRGRASQSNNPDNQLGYGIPNFNYVITSADAVIPADFVSVFPNPALNQVKIEFLDNVQSDQLNITLVDAKGTVSNVGSSQISNREFLIDLSDKEHGLYLLLLQRGRQISTHKILKIE